MQRAWAIERTPAIAWTRAVVIDSYHVRERSIAAWRDYLALEPRSQWSEFAHRRLNDLLQPTVLTDVPDDAKVSCDEVFGPVCIVNAYDTLDEAVERANGTRFGLQAGIFTSTIATALRAAERLEFGGVTVNEAPTFRSDQMPYGGVKDSGNTKEGPAWAVREMTEERLVVIDRS